MKVHFVPTLGTSLTGIDEVGNEVRLREVCVTPMFKRKRETVLILRVDCVTNSGKSVDNCVLQVSGATGKMIKKDSEPAMVTPEIDGDEPAADNADKPASNDG